MLIIENLAILFIILVNTSKTIDKQFWISLSLYLIYVYIRARPYYLNIKSRMQKTCRRDCVNIKGRVKQMDNKIKVIIKLDKKATKKEVEKARKLALKGAKDVEASIIFRIETRVQKTKPRWPWKFRRGDK